MNGQGCCGGDLVSNPNTACAASPLRSFFYLAVIIQQRNKIILSAGNLIEVSSRKSFYNCEEYSGASRSLIISNNSFSSYTVSKASRN